MGLMIRPRKLGALVAVAGSLLAFCASAQAKLAQTITFMSMPPSEPVAGGSYPVSATETSGGPVSLQLEGACSGYPVAASEEDRLQGPVALPQIGVLYESPATAYFHGPGNCSITARGSADAEYESPPQATEDFSVARDPSAQIIFTSAPPSGATVGGSYDPIVRVSPGIRVSFSTTTPTVCTIDPEHTTVNLVGSGTCTIGVGQTAAESQPPEAQQSFTVAGVPDTSAPGATTSEPPPTVTSPTEIETGPTEIQKPQIKLKKSATKQGRRAAEGDIPPKARAKMRKDALQAAAKFGEHEPSDLQLVYVDSAGKKLLRNSRHAADDETPAYVMAMRGHFRAPCASKATRKVKASECQVSFPILELRFYVARSTRLAYLHRYPNLAALGVPIKLDGLKRSR